VIKSPLRYPGGKSKAIPQIIRYIPATFSEYREPFVGGGSLFIYLSQMMPELKIWINDLNEELYLFWKIAQSDLDALVEEIKWVKSFYKHGKELFRRLTQSDSRYLSELERAARFFILNRITFSGTVESGGFSEQAFHKRFTDSSIERLSELEDLLEAIEITNLDYSDLLLREGSDVFIFLDPPYFSATKSKLYGKKGDLHLAFDHERFAALLKKCPHQWLITYDDSPEIRSNFEFANIYAWEFQYGMNNYKQTSAAKGKELFITNYEIQHHSETEQLVFIF
jgi:DNA adenine methylase